MVSTSMQIEVEVEVEVEEKDGKKRKIEGEVAVAVEEKDGNGESATFPVIGKPIGDGPLRPFSKCHWNTLFELIRARILHNVGTEEHGRMVGTIHLEDSFSDWHLYNTDEDSAETVAVPGELKLSTPKRGTLADDRVYIYFHLKGDFEELNECVFSWGRTVGFTIPYDKVWTRTIRQTKWSMELTSITHNEAVLADMEIKLRMLRHSREFDSEICGKVVASITNRKGVEFDLFNKESDDSVPLCIGDEEFNVPLSRCVVAVPLGSALDIEVDISIASGIARFEPTYRGEHMATIHGEHGMVEVRVTFWNYWDHPETQKDHLEQIRKTFPDKTISLGFKHRPIFH